MAHATMREFIPEHCIAALQILGKYDWLEITPHPVLPRKAIYHPNLPLDPGLDRHRSVLREIFTGGKVDARTLIELFVISKALADGPKMICPPEDLCEALENVSVDIPFEDYRQPFPVVIVEFPEGFRNRMTAKYGLECFKYVMLYHDPVTHRIIALAAMSGNGMITINTIYPSLDTPHIEDSLTFRQDDGDDLKQAEVLQRIAIGLGLLLTNYGAKDLGPANPDEHRRNLRNARRKNKGKAERGRAGIAAEVHLIGFEQEVEYCERREERSDGDAHGTTRRPHWRRGHFRRQACGTGWRQHRVIFIKPIFINAGAFQGSQADTSYRITIPEGTGSPVVPPLS